MKITISNIIFIAVPVPQHFVMKTCRKACLWLHILKCGTRCLASSMLWSLYACAKSPSMHYVEARVNLRVSPDVMVKRDVPASQCIMD
jgi:hypothetical protein